jgi:hypothetical protein
MRRIQILVVLATLTAWPAPSFAQSNQIFLCPSPEGARLYAEQGHRDELVDALEEFLTSEYDCRDWSERSAELHLEVQIDQWMVPISGDTTHLRHLRIFRTIIDQDFWYYGTSEVEVVVGEDDVEH